LLIPFNYGRAYFSNPSGNSFSVPIRRGNEKFGGAEGAVIQFGGK